MKKLLIALLALAGCGHSGDTKSPVFLPGIYVRESDNEFCRIVDTFIIRRVAPGGVEYQVTRKSAFQRIRGDQKLPVEYQSEEWPAVYDEAKRMLAGGGRNQQLNYSEEDNRIYQDRNAYEKVE
jgi:hypothetical protein